MTDVGELDVADGVALALVVGVAVDVEVLLAFALALVVGVLLAFAVLLAVGLASLAPTAWVDAFALELADVVGVAELLAPD